MSLCTSTPSVRFRRINEARAIRCKMYDVEIGMDISEEVWCGKFARQLRGQLMPTSSPLDSSFGCQLTLASFQIKTFCRCKLALSQLCPSYFN